MTLAQFYRSLAAAPDALTLTPTQHGPNIRLVDRAHRYYCPITAVAKMETGVRFLMSDYGNAAASIGLSSKHATMVVNAADRWDPTVANSKLSPALRRVRHHLKKALKKGQE